MLRNGRQRSVQGGVNGFSGDTRFSVNGNYFDQVGVIPGQGYRRGSASRRSITRRTGSVLA